MRRRGCERRGRSRRSWQAMWCCVPRWSGTWKRSTRRSRSPAGCRWSSPTIRRCGCRTRRSISRCMCRRGALRRELTKCLQTGRALRHPSPKPGQRKNRIPEMVNIFQRPAEAEDRAVPGHWEGDLIIGKLNQSAIGTLVERSTGYTMLVHLPDGYKPEQVAPALAAKIQTLPEAVRQSLTWDQGPDMRDWKQVRVAADIAIFFCDPHAPWQRGTNENTVSLVVARLGWSGRLVPAAWGDPRKHWPPVGVPCVGPVPRVADTDLAHSSWLDQELVRP